MNCEIHLTSSKPESEMEDSAKRRELLQAMRAEFAQTDASAETSTDTGHLSNPLAETPGTFLIQETSYQTQGFDFYKDPISAFSSKKRNKNNGRTELVSQFPLSIPGSLGNSHVSFQAGHYVYDSGNPHIGPRGMAHPSPLYHGTPQLEGWNNFKSPTCNFRPFQSPRPVAGPFPSYQGNPDPRDRFGGRGNFNRPLNPDYAPPFSNYVRQNPYSGGRTVHGWGRGRGGGRNMKTGFCRNEGRQQKYDHVAYQAAGPERFYNNSMAEDPWKHLKPVLWKRCSDASSSFSTRRQAWL
ncbi:PREDICTED: uncharacterized protein LOC104799788 [Tarenaya hassleriana]|uniref:uncharacterized protein LOC104799788 n=1 Tax=Tarenaya hassleriana TaxID=28532 RepID=UPI0008FD00A3|nr:PREDICTED: uncharacterized protein LOC104799788 [Tarenaya hassleriana]